MGKKKYILVFLAILMSSMLFVHAYSVSNEAQKFEELLSGVKIGIIYRDEIQSRVNTLIFQAWFETVLGVAVLLVAFIIVRKPSLLKILAMILVLSFGLFQFPIGFGQEVIYFRPRIDVPNTIEIYPGVYRFFSEAYGSIIVVPAIRYHSGFSAFLLAAGNPSTGEFLEVGYFEDELGLHLYSSSVANGAYELKSLGSAVLNWRYDLSVFVVGYSAVVHINGSAVNRKTFSQPMQEYTVQYETVDPYNKVNNQFNDMKLEYTYYDIENGGWTTVQTDWLTEYATVVNHDPYYVQPLTRQAGAVYNIYAAIFSGGIDTPLGKFSGASGGYITNVDPWDR